MDNDSTLKRVTVPRPADTLRRELNVMAHDEVCAVIGIEPTTGYNRIRAGDWPPSFKVGRHRLYDVPSFQRWLRSRRES